MRLKPASLCPLHILADALHAGRVHGVLSECLVFEQVLNLRLVEGALDRLGESSAHLGLLAVANGFDEKIAERLALEVDLAEDVEDLPTESLARLLELLEQLAVDVAFAGLLGNEVPEVTDLGLPDAVNAAEALLETVWVPGQVVVHHEVCALEVDALSRCIRRYQDLHFGVVLEGLLDLQPLFAPDTAVDHRHRFRTTEERLNPALEVVQGVLVLGEDDQLLLGGRGRLRSCALAVQSLSFADLTGESGGREDLGEQVGEFPPLAVRSIAADCLSETLESLEREDLGLELVDGLCRSGLVEDLGFGRFDLILRSFIEVLDVFRIEQRSARHERGWNGSSLEELELTEAALEAFLAAAE